MFNINFDFKKVDIKVISDSDLMQLFRLAQEMQCGKYITACRKEMSRRNAEA